MCVLSRLPAALSLGGRVICALISPEQRETRRESSLFLSLWVCNKASRSKSFNLSRNEGYISVFWLQRTISPSFFPSFLLSHTETQPALLIESWWSCSVYVYVCVCVERLAASSKDCKKLGKLFNNTSRVQTFGRDSHA